MGKFEQEHDTSRYQNPAEEKETEKTKMDNIRNTW
jgi:hypothetical protein